MGPKIGRIANPIANTTKHAEKEIAKEIKNPGIYLHYFCLHRCLQNCYNTICHL